MSAERWIECVFLLCDGGGVYFPFMLYVGVITLESS